MKVEIILLFLIVCASAIVYYLSMMHKKQINVQVETVPQEIRKLTFSDMRQERTYDKESGLVVGDQVGNL